MRSQTISTTSDGRELLPGAVDPTGWLVGPRSSGSVAGQRAAQVLAGGRPGADRTADDSPTPTPQRSGRRAGRPGAPSDRRTAESIERSARRAARARHLRRVRAATADRRPLVGDQAAAAPSVRLARVEQELPQGYRMGRWARLTLTLTVLAAAVVVAVSMTAGAAPTALVDVTVGPGDTLWAIATEAAPSRDPRDVIEEINRLNNLSGSVLPVGIVLRVPTGQ